MHSDGTVTPGACDHGTQIDDPTLSDEINDIINNAMNSTTEQLVAEQRAEEYADQIREQMENGQNIDPELAALFLESLAVLGPVGNGAFGGGILAAATNAIAGDYARNSGELNPYISDGGIN